MHGGNVRAPAIEVDSSSTSIAGALFVLISKKVLFEECPRHGQSPLNLPLMHVAAGFGNGIPRLQKPRSSSFPFREAGISIVTSVPINRQMPPVDLLHERGVEVSVGNDNIFDVWSPLGNGDILERAGRLAERFKWIDEVSLSRSLGYITGGKTPLDDKGNQVWPKVGDAGSLVLIDASCSAEAVARRSERKAVIYKGSLVSGSLYKQKQSIER